MGANPDKGGKSRPEGGRGDSRWATPAKKGGESWPKGGEVTHESDPNPNPNPNPKP